MVPAGIEIPLVTTKSYSSKNTNTNTKIDLRVASDVYYNNCLVFKRGSYGYAYPILVEEAKRFGVTGKINLRSAYVSDIMGKEQLLNLNYNNQGKRVMYTAGAGLLQKVKMQNLHREKL